MDHRSELAALEQYYDAAPRPHAVSRECGPFTVFVRSDPRGWPYYARPRRGLQTPVETADVRRVLAYQRAIGIPQALEWVHDVTPSLMQAARSADIDVEECPLLLSSPHGTPDVAPPSGYRVEILKWDDTRVGYVAAAIDAAFRGSDTAGPPDAGLRPAHIRDGLLVLVGAFDSHGRAIGGGMHNPRGIITELTGIATLAAHRGRGIGRAVTGVLTEDAHAAGLQAFLSAATMGAATVYQSVGYARVGTACVAEA